MSPRNVRDWRLYAEDIIEACSKVRRFVAGMSYEAFAADDRTQDAVMRNLEIIGEAAKNIPDEVDDHRALLVPPCDELEEQVRAALLERQVPELVHCAAQCEAARSR
jgi:hypothetical protein